MSKKIFIGSLIVAFLFFLISVLCSNLLDHGVILGDIDLKMIGAGSLYLMSLFVVIAIVAGVSHYIFWEPPVPPERYPNKEIKNESDSGLHIVR